MNVDSKESVSSKDKQISYRSNILQYVFKQYKIIRPTKIVKTLKIHKEKWAYVSNIRMWTYACPTYANCRTLMVSTLFLKNLEGSFVLWLFALELVVFKDVRFFHITILTYYFTKKKKKTKLNFENEILKYLIMVTQKILWRNCAIVRKRNWKGKF